MMRKIKQTAKIFFYGSWLICACNQKGTVDEKKEVINLDSVKVFLLTMDSVKKSITLPGELLANKNVQIRSKMQGYIRKINVDIGSRVNKGQVLAIIDAPEVNSRVQELNARVNAAQAKYLSSKDYYDRINVASKSDGVVAASELQKMKNQMMSDSSEYKAAIFAASSYKEIGGYLAIVAPFSGVITKRNIDAGTYVGNANENSLFDLEDNSSLRLQIPVPEIYTGAVLAGNSAELTTRAYPDRKFKATLSRKAETIDNQTRTETWEFEIPNPKNELKPGGYADVKLVFLRPQNSFVVPSSAVVTTLEKKFVIRVVNNLSQWVDVRTGFNMGEKLEIFGDLHAGDTLVLKPSEELKSGTKVFTRL